MRKTILLILTFILSVSIFIVPVYADGTVIGQATAGETGRGTNNKAGDQTGREAALANWGYGNGPYKWVYVFRAKDPDTAKKLAETMKEACANNHIGYDLNERGTCYDEAKKVGWDVSRISTNCETSCVDLVSVCLNAAGISMPRLWASVSVYGDLMPTGLFDCYTSKDYVASSANLLPGDILCNPDGPHSAMVVESPNKFSFKVTYQNTKGEEDELTVEEGTEITVSPNNGEDISTVTIEETTSLQDYEPKKRGAEFEGWEEKNGVFKATYSTKTAPLYTGNAPKKLAHN